MTNDEILAAAQAAEPLIFTTEGNLPLRLLRCETSWQFVPKGDGTLREIWCIQEWFRLDNGKSVKRQPLGFLNEGVDMSSQQGQPT